MRRLVILSIVLAFLILSSCNSSGSYTCSGKYDYEMFVTNIRFSEDKSEMYFEPIIKNCTKPEVTIISSLPTTRVIMTTPDGEEALWPSYTAEALRGGTLHPGDTYGNPERLIYWPEQKGSYILKPVAYVQFGREYNHREKEILLEGEPIEIIIE